MANNTMLRALSANFLGSSPVWYKQAIIAFLIVNPILLVTVGPFVTGWFLIAEFIFCLAMALKCYPLQPGGLLALEAVILGLTSAETVYEEIVKNFPILLLLMFMVAGIYFLKELLLFTFTKILLSIESKAMLSLMFCGVAAVLSAFLDALTVTAVIITVAQGFYMVFYRAAAESSGADVGLDSGDEALAADAQSDLNQFRGFLRSLLMHAAVGTALGGVSTMVGEPQNLLIAKVVGLDFVEFFMHMLPVSAPVFVVGLITCYLLERTRLFGFGEELPERVRAILTDFAAEEAAKRTARDVATLTVQAVVAVLLVMALGLHLAEVGIIGLLVIVLATAFNGVVEEHRIGGAFHEAMPFTSLLVVFFGIVAVIHDQHLFKPVVDAVLTLDGKQQAAAFYLANGVLSAISDNVFVATVYISEVATALENGRISRLDFERLAVAINAGTNIASVATPNGQAAFLFLLTSALAPLVRLSYGRMVWMALPYVITLTTTGLLAILFLLP